MAAYYTATATCNECPETVTWYGDTQIKANSDRDDKLTKHYNETHPRKD